MITEASQKFIDELIAEIGEPAAIQLLEEASAFRALRMKSLSGDMSAFDDLIGTISGWEESDEVPIFVTRFVPYLREMSLLKPAELIAKLQPGTEEAKHITAAVKLLRDLAGGRLAQQLQASVCKGN